MFEQLNRSGSEERGRAVGAFPDEGSLWRRASWVLFNRQQIRSQASESAKLAREYYEIVGYPPRYVPELRQRVNRNTALDTSHLWLRRISPTEIAHEVDAVQWAPLLVPHSTAEHPEYHLPICPVPARDSRDSVAGWKHMTRRAVDPPRALNEWLERARSHHAGLLLFPRNPAERVLDAKGQIRT
jgi:hypothetical protein